MRLISGNTVRNRDSPIIDAVNHPKNLTDVRASRSRVRIGDQMAVRICEDVRSP